MDIGLQRGPLRAGLLLTLADLYRRNRPELTGRFASAWRAALAEVVGDRASLTIPEPVHTAAECAAAVAQCEAAGCDLLLVAHMAYTPSGALIEALRATRLPLVLVSSARDATLPYDMGPDHLLADQSMHGAFDLANVLWRAGRRFAVVAGHPGQDTFRASLHRVLRVAAGARILRRGRVGRIGEPFEGMLDFAYDPVNQRRALGFEIVPIDAGDYLRRTSRVAAARRAQDADWARSVCRLDEDLTSDELEAGIDSSAVLADVVREHALDAVAMSFLALTGAGAVSLPFLGASRLMAEGIGYAGEGDALTAALVSALGAMTGEAGFTEMFCPDYGRSEILLSHMGECNLAMARPGGTTRLAARPFPWGACKRIPVAVFQLRPGAVTLAGISETPAADSFRMLAFCGRVLEAPDHPNLKNPYARLQPGPDARAFVERYTGAGGTHHLALVYGDARRELADLAAMCGLSFETIDMT